MRATVSFPALLMRANMPMTSRSSSLRISPSGLVRSASVRAVIMSSRGWSAPLLDLTDVVADREVHGLLGLGRQALLALFAVEADVAPFPELVVVLFGETEQARDDHHRKAHAEVLDEVEALFSDERIEVLARTARLMRSSRAAIRLGV